LHFAEAALRVQKNQAIKEFDFVPGADAAVEIVEIGAAAEGDVLAIIDVLAVGWGNGEVARRREGMLSNNQTRQPTQLARRRLPVPPACRRDHDHVFQEWFFGASEAP
jgi:hypothetical protein